jgi:type II secretory ATPase GspE/PulE/Tfp pilus assembly ATPase PilB-like protein
MTETPKRKIGDILLQRGFITEDQLRAALGTGKRVGEALLAMGALTTDELNWALSELLGVPYVEFSDEMVDLDLARTVSEDLLRRHTVLPVLRVGDQMTVIMADPTNRVAIHELEQLTGLQVTVALAARETVLHLLDRAFPRREAAQVRFADVEADVTASGGPTEAQVYNHILGAIRDGATEIHLEPGSEAVRVRHRIDGRLVERARRPAGELGPVLTRLRTMAGLGSAVAPVQGRLRTRLQRQEVDLELHLFPSVHGEAASLRIWRGPAEAPRIEDLGLAPRTRAALARLARPPGLVVVASRDPRARAAVLYAMARAAAAEGRKVVTIERTVAFVVPDYVQVELSARFADGAPAVLLQPLDVALVEELDAGTVRSALEAVGEGALVIGGLPTASGRAGVAGLLSGPVPRGGLLDALRGVVSVGRTGAAYRLEVLTMTEGLRRELLREGQGPWTSPTS